MIDISKNIKKVMIVFLMLFLFLISYLAYFQLFKAQEIVKRPDNGRILAKRKEVLRGVIYDRNMKELVKSKKIDKTKQERTYIYGDMFAHSIGYENDKYGLIALEKRYDKELIALDRIDFTEAFNFKKAPKEKKGYNVVTTLDYNVQKAAYDGLGDNRGSVVAINPKTGELLAMVSKPSYDPNNIEKQWQEINSDKSIPLLNRAVSGLYPPGSTFKTVTAVSALENLNGVLNRSFQDNGELRFNSKESLKNFAGESFGSIRFQEAYVHSSNVVFGTLGLELGNKKLKDTAEKFYFNKDIPAEGLSIENSKFPSYKEYEKGNIAQSAIGQAQVLTTPMEMALVAASIANNGVMMKPTLVNKVIDENGKEIRKINPEQISQVMSSNNAEVMKKLMRETVKRGTGRRANVDGMEVCGKTGTADHQKSSAGYEPPHSWFIGFAPYSNPNIAVAVIVENGGQGGSLAAEITANVISAYKVK